MTSEELAEIEQRANAASKGPWKTEYECHGYPVVINNETEICEAFTEQDAAFVSTARSDVPALLVEVRRLTAIADAAFALKAARHGLQQALERLANQGDDDVSLNAATAAASGVYDVAQRRLDMMLAAYEKFKPEALG